MTTLIHGFALPTIPNSIAFPPKRQNNESFAVDVQSSLLKEVVMGF